MNPYDAARKPSANLAKPPTAPLRGQGPKPAPTWEGLAERRMGAATAGPQENYPNPSWKPAAASQMQQSPAPKMMQQQQQSQQPTPSGAGYKPAQAAPKPASQYSTVPTPSAPQTPQQAAPMRPPTYVISDGYGRAGATPADLQQPGAAEDIRRSVLERMKAEAEAKAKAAAMSDPRVNPGPGYEYDTNLGRWIESATPTGIAADDPGWVFQNGQWVHSPKDAVMAKAGTELADLLDDNAMDHATYSPEDLAKQNEAMWAQAAQAKWEAQNGLAARGITGSGIEAMGTMGIDRATMNDITQLDAENRKGALANYLNTLSTFGNLYGQNLSEADRMELAAKQEALAREQMDYGKEQDKEANAVAMISNALGLTGADQISGPLLAEGLAAYQAGDDEFQQWLSKAQTYAAGDGITEFTRETKTYQPPPGWSGDWNALSRAEQSLILTGYNLGLDTETPPPGSGLTQEAWDSLDAAQKEQLLRGKSGPTQP